MVGHLTIEIGENSQNGECQYYRPYAMWGVPSTAPAIDLKKESIEVGVALIEEAFETNGDGGETNTFGSREGTLRFGVTSQLFFSSSR